MFEAFQQQVIQLNIQTHKLEDKSKTKLGNSEAVKITTDFPAMPDFEKLQIAKKIVEKWIAGNGKGAANGK